LQVEFSVSCEVEICGLVGAVSVTGWDLNRTFS